MGGHFFEVRLIDIGRLRNDLSDEQVKWSAAFQDLSHANRNGCSDSDLQ